MLILAAAATAGGLQFHSPLFTDGMLLQRGTGTMVWGSGGSPLAVVKISLTPIGGNAVVANTTVGTNGNWSLPMPTLVAAKSATLEADDGETSTSLKNVAVGDLLLCGGQVDSSLHKKKKMCSTFIGILIR